MKQAANDRSKERVIRYLPGFGAKDKVYLVASLLLHVVVIVALLFSWRLVEPVQVKPLPSSIQARVLSAEELDLLKQKKLAEKKAVEDARKKAEQKKAEERRLKEQRKKAEEKKRREAEAQKKSEQKRQEEAKKKALIQKREAEKKRREKAESDKKQAEEKLKREEAKRLADLKRKQELERQEALKREAQADRLAERLKALEAQQAEEERLKQQREAEALLEKQRQAANEYALEEQERFMALIRARIENRWHIPPKIKNKSVTMRIRLLPTGELSSAQIIEKSGSEALDQSAYSAVQSVQKFPVPDDKVIFEKYFRQFNMRFTPPEP